MRKRIILLIVLLIFLPITIFGATEEGTATGENDIAGTIVFVINFIITISGIIAFVAIIKGGLGYLVSGGSPMAMAKSKKQILNGLLGVSLILSSYALIRQINPDILSEVFKLPDVSDIQSPEIEVIRPEPTVYQYQEMPFGTILETRILAKNISCFDEQNELVDCYSQQSITDEEKQRIIDLMSEQFPEAWPNPRIEDSEIAYLCYDFDKNGEFLDGDPNRPGIQPIPTNDRLDCIERIVKALDAKSKFLRDRVDELARLSSECQCGYCSCGACPCPPYGTCPCGSPCGGDPCPSRGRMDQIRNVIFRKGGAGLFMDQIIEGKDLLKEDQLVQVSVDSYKDMTVVNQIRYLASHFLPPHIASLQVDLSYLEKVEEMYKMQCEYGTHITHATFQQLIKEVEDVPSIELEVNKFCLNGNQPTWGEECIPVERLNIDQWCREFNCTDCDEESGDKLNCGICNLDKIKKGIAIFFPWGDEEFTSYRCSTYRINQEDGIEGREVTDDLGIMCRIQSDGENCDHVSQGPATFYCPKDFIGAPILTNEQKNASELYLDEYIIEGYPRSHIEIGQLTDNAEVYVQELMSEMRILVDISAPEITCPSYDKRDPMNRCRLYHLPPRCRCDGPQITQDKSGCGPGCGTLHGCLCNNCGSCPGCPCSPCLVGGEMHPCPLSVIFQRRDETRHWYDIDVNSVQKRVEQTKNLILAVDLRPYQPNRAELLNQLEDSEEKLARCVSGFSDDVYLETVLAMPFSCSWLLDLQDLGLESGGLKFNPLIEICYPYNSDSPYGDDALSASEKEACYRDRESKECKEAIADLMFDYFCAEQIK